jgi:hypothetical protein
MALNSIAIVPDVVDLGGCGAQRGGTDMLYRIAVAYNQAGAEKINRSTEAPKNNTASINKPL